MIAKLLPRKRQIRSLLQDTRGAALTEFALTLPVLVLMLTGIADVGHAFTVHNNMTSASQDAARQLAIGAMSTSEAETFAESRLMSDSINYTVTATDSGGDAVVSVSAPLSEAVFVDILGVFSSGTLAATSTVPTTS